MNSPFGLLATQSEEKVNPEEIRADYESMQAKKIELEKKYKAAEKAAKTKQWIKSKSAASSDIITLSRHSLFISE